MSRWEMRQRPVYRFRMSRSEHLLRPRLLSERNRWTLWSPEWRCRRQPRTRQWLAMQWRGQCRLPLYEPGAISTSSRIGVFRDRQRILHTQCYGRAGNGLLTRCGGLPRVRALRRGSRRVCCRRGSRSRSLPAPAARGPGRASGSRGSPGRCHAMPPNRPS